MIEAGNAAPANSENARNTQNIALITPVESRAGYLWPEIRTRFSNSMVLEVTDVFQFVLVHPPVLYERLLANIVKNSLGATQFLAIHPL
jgi:hypothetical protein